MTGAEEDVTRGTFAGGYDRSLNGIYCQKANALLIGIFLDNDLPSSANHFGPAPTYHHGPAPTCHHGLAPTCHHGLAPANHSGLAPANQLGLAPTDA